MDKDDPRNDQMTVCDTVVGLCIGGGFVLLVVLCLCAIEEYQERVDSESGSYQELTNGENANKDKD